MRFFDDIRIGTKLPLVIMGIAILMLALAQLIAVRLLEDALLDSERGRLAAVAEARAAALDQGFQEILADLEQSAGSPMTLAALRAFAQGFERLGDAAPRILRDIYAGADGPDHARIAERLSYPLVHRRYHAEFATVAEARGYGDILLVDAAGNVVYSVAKGAEFSRNLIGPETEATGLAEAMASLLGAGRGASGPGAVSIRRHGDGLVLAREIRSPFGTIQGAIAYRVPDLRLAELGAGSGRLRAVERTALATPGGPVLGAGGDAAVVSPDWLSARANVALGDEVYGVIAAQDRASILEPARRARLKLLGDSVVALFGVLALSLFVARRISIPLSGVGSAIEATAGGDYGVPLPWTRRQDEVGAIARALDRFRAALIDAEGAARERDFKGAAYEGTSAALLLVDRSLTILYANPALENLIATHAGSFARVGRNVGAADLIGRNLAHLFPGAAVLAADLADADGDAVGQEVNFGTSVLRFDMRPVRAPVGDALGYVIEVQDRSDRRADRAVLCALDRTHAVAEFSPDARLVRANRAFRTLVRLGADTGTGLSWSRLVAWSGEAGAGDPWRGVAPGISICGAIGPSDAPGAGGLPATFSAVAGDDGRLARIVVIAECTRGHSHADRRRDGVPERTGHVPC